MSSRNQSWINHYSAMVRPHVKHFVQYGVHQYNRDGTTGKSPEKNTTMTGALLLWGKGEKAGTFQPNEDKSHKCVQISEGRVQKGWRQTLFSVPNERTKVSGHELKHLRIPLNIRKHFFFAVRMMESWYRLLKNVVVSSSLEKDIQKLPGQGPELSDVCGPAWEVVLNQMISNGLFQSQSFWFYDIKQMFWIIYLHSKWSSFKEPQQVSEAKHFLLSQIYKKEFWVLLFLKDLENCYEISMITHFKKQLLHTLINSKRIPLVLQHCQINQ